MKDSFLYIYSKLVIPIISRTIYKMIVYPTIILLCVLLFVGPGHLLLSYSPNNTISYIIYVLIVFSIPSIIGVFNEYKEWGYGIDEYKVFSIRNFMIGLKAIGLLLITYLLSIKQGNEYFFKYIFSLFVFSEAAIIVSVNKHDEIGSANQDEDKL